MIEIVAYDPGWPALFQAEAERLAIEMIGTALRIEHVGSTSVSGLAAKPVIDIQVSVARLHPLTSHAIGLGRLGYVHVPLQPGDTVYPFFQKPASWPSTHHVHLCVAGSEQERAHLLFRDYLRSHAEVAAEYLALKMALAADNDGNTLKSRERYSLSKTAFVISVLARASVEKNKP